MNTCKLEPTLCAECPLTVKTVPAGDRTHLMYLLLAFVLSSLVPPNSSKYQWVVADRSEEPLNGQHLSHLNKPGSCCKYPHAAGQCVVTQYVEIVVLPMSSLTEWWEELLPCMVSSPGRSAW